MSLSLKPTSESSLSTVTVFFGTAKESVQIVAACTTSNESYPHSLLGKVKTHTLQAVLATPVEKIPVGAQEIRGWDFDQGCSLDGIMGAMLNTGIQATALGRAVNEVNRMVSTDKPLASRAWLSDLHHLDEACRKQAGGGREYSTCGLVTERV